MDHHNFFCLTCLSGLPYIWMPLTIISYPNNVLGFTSLVSMHNPYMQQRYIMWLHSTFFAFARKSTARGWDFIAVKTREPLGHGDTKKINKWSSAKCSGLAFVHSDWLVRCISAWCEPFMGLLTLSAKQWLLLNWQKPLWLHLSPSLFVCVPFDCPPPPPPAAAGCHVPNCVRELPLDSVRSVCECVCVCV